MTQTAEDSTDIGPIRNPTKEKYHCEKRSILRTPFFNVDWFIVTGTDKPESCV
jgi:hypothetical protein